MITYILSVSGSLMTGAGMAGLMYYNTKDEDPYVDLKGIEEEEQDDDNIKKEAGNRTKSTIRRPHNIEGRNKARRRQIQGNKRVSQA